MLQQTLHDQLGSLEESHGKQKSSSQQALEKSMNSLRKKILADNVSWEKIEN